MAFARCWGKLAVILVQAAEKADDLAIILGCPCGNLMSSESGLAATRRNTMLVPVG
jgi:hypothetical protein